MQSRFTDLSPALVDFAAARQKAQGFFHTLWRMGRVKFNFVLLEEIFAKMKGGDQDADKNEDRGEGKNSDQNGDRGEDQEDRILTLKRAIARRTRQKISKAIKRLRHKWRKKPKNPDNYPDLTP